MNNEREMSIVYSCDDAFVPHLATLMVSILDNCRPDVLVHFYIIDDGIREENKNLLRCSVYNLRFDTEIEFLRIDSNLFANVVVSERITRAAYYRIAIPELLKERNIERVLYMDCDMVAIKDISALWEIDFNGAIVAAVEDAGFHHRLQKMDVPCQSDCYFNSGLMLINVKEWLDQQITQQVLKFIEENPEKLRFHDQDALNAILHDAWLPLHSRWNAQGYIMDRSKRHPSIIGEKEYQETRRNPSVVHFSGHVKPWHHEFKGPFKEHYFKYYHMTAFGRGIGSDSFLIYA